MARITVEDCLSKEPNRFALVLLAAKRTKQLLSGARSIISSVRNKPVVTALREIAAGQVNFMTDEDMKKAREREAKLRELEVAQAAQVVEKADSASNMLKADDLFLKPGSLKDDDDDDEDLGVLKIDDDDDDLKVLKVDDDDDDDDDDLKVLKADDDDDDDEKDDDAKLDESED